jgi:hypothetical protein
MRRRIRRVGGKGGGMSLRGRRRSVERRLRRHEPVSVDDIVEAFCVLEHTPRGLIPAEGSIETVRRKVAEVAASQNLLLEPDAGADEAPRSRPGVPRRDVPRRGAAPVVGAGATWYLVAVAEDADLVGAVADVTIISRAGGAVLACAPPETAHTLRALRGNLHVYDALEPAVAAFRLFEPS